MLMTLYVCCDENVKCSREPKAKKKEEERKEFFGGIFFLYRHCQAFFFLNFFFTSLKISVSGLKIFISEQV